LSTRIGARRTTCAVPGRNGAPGKPKRVSAWCRPPRLLPRPRSRRKPPRFFRPPANVALCPLRPRLLSRFLLAFPPRALPAGGTQRSGANQGMAKFRCAILDDYQNVALASANWSKVQGDLDIKVFNEHLGGPDKVVAALQGFEIICAMRERTGFPRAVIEKLPKLKLLITTGMRHASIDVAAPTERGATACGPRPFRRPPP